MSVPDHRRRRDPVTNWVGEQPDADTLASIMLGVEQLKHGQGTFLTDADLETDVDG